MRIYRFTRRQHAERLPQIVIDDIDRGGVSLSGAP